jgi:hypothetical protein
LFCFPEKQPQNEIDKIITLVALQPSRFSQHILIVKQLQIRMVALSSIEGLVEILHTLCIITHYSGNRSTFSSKLLRYADTKVKTICQKKKCQKKSKRFVEKK